MASTHKGELIDQYSRVSDEGNELTLRYCAPGKEDDMPVIAFYTTDIHDRIDDVDITNKVILEYKDITLKFINTTTKYVPVGYEMTKEDQERLQTEEGAFFIEETEESYLLDLGVVNTKLISWTEDEIGYTLLSSKGDQFTQEEFLEMAKAIIDSES